MTTTDEALRAGPDWHDGQLNRFGLLDDLPTELADAISRHTQLFMAWHGARAEAAGLDQAAQRAITDDADARAHAVAAGTRPPKPAAPAATAAATAARGRQHDLGRGLHILEQQIRELTANHRELVAQLDTTDRRELDEARAALTRVGEILRRSCERSVLRQTLTNAFDVRSWRPAWPPPTPRPDLSAAIDTLLHGWLTPPPAVVTSADMAVPGGFYRADGARVFDPQSDPAGSVELEEVDFASLQLGPA